MAATTLAASLTGILAGDLVPATVVGTDAAGRPLLRTPDAIFAAFTAADLPRDAALLLSVTAIGATVHAAVVETGGHAVTPPVPAELTLLSLLAPTAAAAPVEVGTILHATLLSPAPAEAALELPTHFDARVIAVQAPTLALSAPPPATGAAMAFAAPAAAGAQSSEAQTLIAATSSLIASLNVATPAAATPPPELLRGTVLSAQPATAVIQTALGPLTVPTDGPLPIGARVILEAWPGTQLPPRIASVTVPEPSGTGGRTRLTAIVAGPSPAGGALATSEIGLLRLEGAVPVTGTHLILEVTPAAPLTPVLATILSSRLQLSSPQFLSNFLSFLSALKSDLPSWLGPDFVKTLKRESLDRLRSEFADLQKAHTNPQNDWVSVPLPFYDGTALQQLWMFTRKQKHPDDPSQPESTRFVIDMDLTLTGPLQLDGLIRGKRFDLILRSERVLPQSMRADLTRIMDDALGATGSAGSLVFDVAKFVTLPRIRAARDLTA